MASFKDPQQSIIVIGAGAAGLAATRHLLRHGWSVLLLEARDRLGGRVFTARPASVDTDLDLGAEFVHGKAPELRHLSLRGHGRMIKLRDTHEVWWRGQRLAREDFFGSIEEANRKLRVQNVSDRPVIEALRDLHVGTSELNFALYRRYVEGFNAADLTEYSTRAFIDETERSDDDGTTHRILPGYRAAIDSLAQELDDRACEIRLRHEVTRIRWRRGHAEVYSTGPGGATVDHAAAVLVTVPAPILANGKSLFFPALPDKIVAAGRLAMGPVVKVVHVFRERLWRGESDIHYIHSPELIFTTRWSWDWMKSFVVTSWAGGGVAEALRGLSRDQVVERALADLATASGLSPAEVKAFHRQSFFHDWQKDPHSQGAYSYVRVGGKGSREILAAPVEKTLYFAGEATCADGSAGTVHGAIRSGRRAARECLRDHAWWNVAWSNVIRLQGRQRGEIVIP